MALTKLDLSVMLSEKLKINRSDSSEIVDFFFEAIRASLESGENVHLSGFGNFNLRDKKSRPGRNPKTGQSYEITPRRVVTFHAGLKLKVRLQSLNNHENDGQSDE